MANKHINELTDYTPPLDADVLPIYDNVNSSTKKLSWLNLKATLKTYFDTLYSSTYTLTKAAVEAVLTGVITTHSHTVTKSDVGLGSVDNTADTAKPVSTAQQTALNLKANLASPTFTGTVGGITAAMVSAPSGSGTSSGTNTGDQTLVGLGGISASSSDTLTNKVIDASQLVDGSAKPRKIKSGLYTTNSWTEFTTTSVQPTFVDVTGCSIASVVLDVASDVEVKLFVDYIRNSAVGNSQNLIQILISSTVMGGPYYVTQNTSGWNDSRQYSAIIFNQPAGTYTFKVQVANNAAGTLTFGSGRLSVRVRATGT